MSTEPVDVLLVGLGAIGGIYSFVLERSQRCRVTAIARSKYESIQTHGLTIQSEKYGLIENWRPYRLTRSAEEAADRDYRFIVCCVKSLPDVECISAILAPLLLPYHEDFPNSTCHPPPAVVLIQNGIGIEQELAEAFPLIHIISCVSWLGANLITPPVVPGETSTPPISSTMPLGQIAPRIEHGPQDRLVFGLYEGEGFQEARFNEAHSRTCNGYAEGLLARDKTPLIGVARVEKLQNGTNDINLFLELLTAGGCEAEAVEHIQPARWAKNLFNGAYSSMCTLSRSTISQFLVPEVLPHTIPVARETMLEMLCVARALGYQEAELPAKTIDGIINFILQHYKPKGNVPETPSTLTTPPVIQETRHSESPDDAARNKGDGSAHVETAKDNDTSAGSTSFKPSMLLDVEKNRPIELEPIVGAVLERARNKAVETPRLDLLYAMLKVLQVQVTSNN
ncbi:hypothetical protein MJO28_008254 [Puccinia striiformis f. sp. tritici]|uniref:2-dehydropantoate 2-reductase n=3 Tax=Puccinia striiformis TaxID=27350 RepID=A0A0L0V0B0_9BASI|nr:hypothetical protein Pst134EA_015677 [Puccinia striiformis f. sp. tritici]KAI9602605.1 hypothetical protein H4Q26_001896 [Puccinia striiformis f. sp. tritici PST-130]KNE92722.1 hypothetical protein PSTG_13853 [Puccinia striiformis f. sp. tritici PST-78]POW13382.1 hypothetical protein PSTT_03799 [Puccinia striiformis]KAH9452833.1 hypothetical protein Pst134EB_016784 [Puccinia striiformis f. sp. tritici]KAH9463590.1 hypothetical protein Pst134EA_015677 [Puccinia striiformis f. sp. tritici]